MKISSWTDNSDLGDSGNQNGAKWNLNFQNDIHFKYYYTLRFNFVLTDFKKKVSSPIREYPPYKVMVF